MPFVPDEFPNSTRTVRVQRIYLLFVNYYNHLQHLNARRSALVAGQNARCPTLRCQQMQGVPAGHLLFFIEPLINGRWISCGVGAVGAC